MIRIKTITELTLILGFILLCLCSELHDPSECSWFASVVLFEGSLLLQAEHKLKTEV
jgi:hypothetical protein